MKRFLTKSRRLLLADIVITAILIYFTYYAWANPKIGISPLIPGAFAIVFLLFSFLLYLSIRSGIADVVDEIYYSK